jgi:hypothetical protein
MLTLSEPKYFKRIKVDEINEIPWGKGGVYFIEDRFGEVIYIGKTVSFRRRLTEHVRDSYFSAVIYTIRLYEMKDGFTREIYETYLINKYRPYYNKDKIYDDPSDNARTVEYHELQGELTELQTERAELREELRRRHDPDYVDDYDMYDDDDRNFYRLGDDLYDIERLRAVEDEIRRVKNRLKTVKSRIF